jgi:hypothetical protein
VVNVKSSGRALGVIVGGNFSDPTNERLIFLSAAGLALVGIGLLIGTIVWWRRGRQEHPALAPLEVMGGRAWAKAAEGDRRRRLDQVRLDGAGATANDVAQAEPVDLEALVRSVPQAFDDLREPGAVIDLPVVAESAEPAGEADVVAPDVDVAEAVEAAVVDDPVVDAEVVPDAEADAAPASTAKRPTRAVAKPRKPRAPRAEPVGEAQATESTPPDADVVEADAVDVPQSPAAVEVPDVDVDATSFAAERPSGDLAPATAAKRSTRAPAKPRKSKAPDPTP